MKPSTFNFKLSTMRSTRRKKLHRRAVAKIRRYDRCFYWCLRRIDDMVKATMPTELKRDENMTINFTK